MKHEVPNFLIILAGAGQIFVALIYPYVRHKVFDWYNDIQNLKPLNQEIARTYGRYIQELNFAFGLTAILLHHELKDGSVLAFAFTSILSAYWIGKIATQIAYYPMYEIPKKVLFKWGGMGMNTLFILFAVVFTWLAICNGISVIN